MDFYNKMTAKNQQKSIIMKNNTILMIMMIIITLSITITQQAMISSANNNNNNNGVDDNSNNLKTLPSSSSSDQSAVNSNNNDNNGLPSSAAVAKLLSDEMMDFDTSNIYTSNDWKRASGFLPMRGRKSLADMNNYEMILDDQESQLFSDQSSQPQLMNADEFELMDLIEKRNRINSFMPMRGRKSLNYLMNRQQQEQQQQPKPYNRQQQLLSNYYVRPLTNSNYLLSSSSPSKSYRYYKTGNSGMSNFYHQLDQKRGKGVAFFGARG